MSRPKPTVILENIDKNNYKCEQILKAEAIWAVFYKRCSQFKKHPNVQQIILTSNIRRFSQIPTCT